MNSYCLSAALVDIDRKYHSSSSSDSSTIRECMVAAIDNVVNGYAREQVQQQLNNLTATTVKLTWTQDNGLRKLSSLANYSTQIGYMSARNPDYTSGVVGW